MGVKFKVGQRVRLIQPEIAGIVEDNQIVDGEIHPVVIWKSGEDLHRRTFHEDMLEAVGGPPPAQAAEEAVEAAQSAPVEPAAPAA